MTSTSNIPDIQLIPATSDSQLIPATSDSQLIPATSDNQPIPSILDELANPETIECTVNNMFNDLEGKGTCILSTDPNTYITIYTHKNDNFQEKFKSLELCFATNTTI